MSNKLDWYAIQTYTGYEEKVAETIRQKTETLNLQDKIKTVLVPKEKMIEIKNGKRKTVEKKIFQGYVLMEASLSDDVWYAVRNTPGVTGFVGSGNDPVPLEKEEIEKIQKRIGKNDPKHQILYNIGEIVGIIDGPFKGFDGSIAEIDQEKGKLKVLVSMFGRETPVELDGLQVKKNS